MLLDEEQCMIFIYLFYKISIKNKNLNNIYNTLKEEG